MTRLRSRPPKAVGVVAAVTLSLTIAGLGAATAAPGDPDPGFGGDGEVEVVPPAVVYGSGVDVDALPDGSVVVGTRDLNPGTDDDHGVVRLLADGTLDATFSSDGVAGTSFQTGSFEYLRGSAVDSTGRVVTAGYSLDNATPGAQFLPGIARFTTAGVLDTAFSGDGKVSVTSADTTTPRFVTDVAIDAEDRVLVSGYGQAFEFRAARLTTTGSFDGGFSGDGRAAVTFEGRGNSRANVIRVLDGGDVLLAGTAAESIVGIWAMARLDPDGDLDPDFGGDGRVTRVPPLGFGEITAVDVDASGRLVAAGFEQACEASCPADASRWTVARFNPDGTLDRTFGDRGFVAAPVAGVSSRAEDVVVDPRGWIIVVGTVSDGVDNAPTYTIARYRPDGSPDPTFGDGGTVRIAAAPAFAEFGTRGGAVTLDSERRIVATGSRYFSGDRLLVHRLDNTGRPPRIRPVARIAEPAARVRLIRGTAGPAGQVAKVQVALQRVDRRLQRRGKCRWLLSRKPTFVTRSMSATGCLPKTRKHFLRVPAGARWKLTLESRLPPGRYTAFVKVTLVDGSRHTTYTKAQRNRRSFRAR